MRNSTHCDNTLFDLGKLIQYLVSKWKWFVLFGFSTAIIFAYISTQLPNQYTSEVVLVAADSGSNGIEGLSGQLGGLASLAGVSLNSGKDNSLLALQILKSRKFLVDFVKNQKIEEQLFAIESWDKELDEYIYDIKKYDLTTKKWLMRSDRPISYYPTDAEIYEEMTSLLDVEVDKANQVTKVSFSYYNPLIAQQWLTLLIETLNNTLRSIEITEREDQIHFLQEQLELQTNAEIRNVFYTLIEEQLKSSTLAKARAEFAFKVIDPAMLPEYKSSPKRALITVLGGLVGGVFCFILLTVFYLIRK